ncbi:MAG TPA: alanine racemase [Terracidiphilus sp.]|nr:alanine racemase [Terracidiphilus sp.]
MRAIETINLRLEARRGHYTEKWNDMPTRPCWVEICPRALEDNFRFLKQAAGQAELLAIVKANAYGHSLALCAPAAARAGARWLGVTSVEEGVAARAVCPDAQILIISGVFRGQGGDVIRHALTSVVWEKWQLAELEGAATIGTRPIRVHLEIDTGMSRQGAGRDDLPPLLARLGAGSPLQLDGIMTHLFAADEADGAVTREQLVRLAEALDAIRAAGLQPEWLNVGNSAALLSDQAETIAELAGRFGMKALIRPGLALYGLVPRFNPPFAGSGPAVLTSMREQLRPVLSWKTQVVALRSVAAGTSVGYNGTFVATEPMRLALLAVGYADGLDRKLGNRFSLLVRGQRAPLVGRISMDQAVLDVTGIEGVATGDEVVILGSQGEEIVSAFDHADAAGTIPWEIFTRIGARVTRIPVEGSYG